MEQPHRQYFEAAPCYFSVQDRELRVIDANRRFTEDFGPWEGRHCYELYKHRDEPCDDCPVEKTFRHGRSFSSEQRVLCMDGREVSVIVYTTPIRNGTGEVVAVLEMSTDVTRMKLLQQDLRVSRERYRHLFEDVPCYVVIQDAEHRVVEANRLTREVFGRARGRLCHEYFKQREDECLECPVRQTLEDGDVHHSEEILISRDGEPIHVLVQAVPIRDEGGRVMQVMEMATDITSIRQLQSQLESVGLLISSVSHGIKGLLTGLDGGKYLVSTGLERDDNRRVKQGWEMVQRNIELIRSMVLNILYYAKEREPIREPVDPLALVKEVCEIVRPRATAHHIDVVAIPGARAEGFQADPRALRSLLVNLLENSIDACRVDRKKSGHRVTVTADRRKGRVRFVVEDNGIGMDAETASRAFSLFFSSKGSEGTGLGLFIANKIANAHGGNIRIESEPDQGTRFVVRLPSTPTDPSSEGKETEDG